MRSPNATKPKRSWVKWLMFVPLSLLSAFGLFLLVGLWLLFSGDSPVARPSAIAATRAWARLAPLPTSATHLAVQIKGGFFTREFIISFEAPAEDVAAWVDHSPGTREATVAVESDHSATYAINPGEGAQFAEVKVSADKTQVRIRTYWS